jgi:predicted GH43/DUF377 family glycosyl hydrolase
MNWKKKGHIYSVENENDWMVSHAQCPTALVLEDRIRIYFSARQTNQQSLPTYIDVNKHNPKEILQVNKSPILDFGRKGSFDENGIIPNYIFEENGLVYLYYAGWSQCKNVPYKNFTGLAISEDNGATFKKVSDGPVFGMNKENPLSATGPCVVKRKNDYFALYSTGIDWVEINGKLEHTYLFASAVSKDLVNWDCSDKILIKPEKEFMAHCKPTMIFNNDIYHLWFSTRGSHDFRNPKGEAYRLGYAESTDLINWKRKDAEVGISVSEVGWDSEMICYPHIVAVENKYYMFYNGNGFGKSGFGFAELILN